MSTILDDLIFRTNDSDSYKKTRSVWNSVMVSGDKDDIQLVFSHTHTHTHTQGGWKRFRDTLPFGIRWCNLSSGLWFCDRPVTVCGCPWVCVNPTVRGVFVEISSTIMFHVFMKFPFYIYDLYLGNSVKVCRLMKCCISQLGWTVFRLKCWNFQY